MHRELVLAVFVFSATDMPLPICTFPGRGARCNMKQFLNTSEAIWTYESTSTRTVKCELNKMESIYPSEITYKRQLLWEERRCDSPLRGAVFSPLSRTDDRHVDR
ncbi:hypothetical protein MTO96_025419 [Rhipicephalus appendiculatus]